MSGRPAATAAPWPQVSKDAHNMKTIYEASEDEDWIDVTFGLDVK